MLSCAIGCALAIGLALLAPMLKVDHYGSLYRPTQLRQEGLHHFTLDLTDTHPEWHIDQIGHQPTRWDRVRIFDEPRIVVSTATIPDFAPLPPTHVRPCKLLPSAGPDPLQSA